MLHDCTVSRLELRQQVEQLSADNEALKCSNETLSNDVTTLQQAVQHGTDVCLNYLWIIFVVFQCQFQGCEVGVKSPP